MLINTGAYLRSQLRPVLAPSPVLHNTVGLVAGAAGGTALFGLAATGGLLGVTTRALVGR